MEFKTASECNDLAWQMRYTEFDRDLNRTRVNKLFNGHPPHSPEEVQSNNINVNVNWLRGTRIAHDARMQAQQGILKPGNFFSATTDAGPQSKRQKWGRVATRAVNSPMKRSIPYYESIRSRIGNNVLHGIGPGCWENSDRWCPDPLGIEDLLIPSATYVTFKNLPFFVICRSFTAPELMKLTRGPEVDPAWNMELVDQCLEWIDRESMALRGSNYPEIWSPTKVEERLKGDGNAYYGDQVPTIDVLDLYFWSDKGNEEGWRRRMVLDDWSTPASVGGSYQFGRNTAVDFAKNQFLYNPKDRIFASRREDIFTCSFADLSAVFPARYHTTRGLGWLIYSVCHLENRLKSKFTESVFESLLMYFRVKNVDDAERVIKLELANRGFFDESLEFIKAGDRYQVNAGLVELGMNELSRTIAEQSSSWTASQSSPDRTEKTKFQVMAEVQASQTLVSSALQQFFTYQEIEYREIFRRFLNPNSRDPEVIEARTAMLKEIPEKYLIPEAWDISAERTLGGGNATLEMAKANALMESRPLYDPAAQRDILRIFTLATTDDPALADTLVPEQPHISDSIHDTELAFGSLMAGSMVTPRDGLNSIEVVAKMLQLMDGKIKQIGPVGTREDLIGMAMAVQYTQGFLQLLSQDKEQKGTAKAFAQVLSQITNEMKAMAQRQAEQQQKQSPGIDPETMAKVQAIQMTAQAKAQNTRESHAQKTAQRQIQWEQSFRQKQLQDAQDLRKKAVENRLDLGNEVLKQRMKSVTE